MTFILLQETFPQDIQVKPCSVFALGHIQGSRGGRHRGLSLPVIPAGASARLMLFAPGLQVSGSKRGPGQLLLTKSTICALGFKNEVQAHK